MTTQVRTDSVQTYAKAAGVLLLLSMIGGGLGEAYIPAKLIVATDAAATAANIRNHDMLFRLGFAAYLVEAICDIALTSLFYVLLRPVQKQLALLAAFFGLVATATFAGAQLFYFASSQVLRDAPYLQAFSPEQRNALVLLAIRTCVLGAGVYMVFYGIAMAIRGWLIFRSTYLPKFLGVLLAAAGVGFFVRAFLVVLAPRYASPALLLPMALAAVALMVWLFVKGVDLRRWDEKVAYHSAA